MISIFAKAIECTSQSLLLYTREGSFGSVKQILTNKCLVETKNNTFHSSINKSSQKPPFMAYNTISGDASTAYKVSNDIDLEIQDDGKQSPLIIACRYGFSNIARLLVVSGADTNAVDSDRWTPLMNACRNGNVAIAELLVKHKAQVHNLIDKTFIQNLNKIYKRFENKK